MIGRLLKACGRCVKIAATKLGLFTIDIPFEWNGYMAKWKHFTDEEVAGLDPTFVEKLDRAREIAGVPFRITSGRRTLLQNEQTSGAAQNSAHLDGLACDLLCEDSESRFKILKALIQVGFCRIGIYERHLHADDSKTLPQNVCWYVKGA